MANRAADDTTPRTAKTRQVCLTATADQMLNKVAKAKYKGHLSVALRDLLDKPLTEAYEELSK